MKEIPSTVDLDQEMISKIPDGSRVLEFASALGRTAFSLEKMGHIVTGIDIDPDAIRLSVNESHRRNSSVEFIEADGRSLPFDDGSFDVCVMNAFLTMLTDPVSRNRAIREAKRVTRKGGLLYIADFLQTWGSKSYKQRYEAHERITGERGTFLVTPDGLIKGEEQYRAHHHTEKEITDLIRGHFEIKEKKLCEFRSFHGNKVNGVKIMASKGLD